MSTSTQNVIDHIFTTAYSYTNLSGFQVQIKTKLDGDVNIGDLYTNYTLYINGIDLLDLVQQYYPPSNWASFPALNTVDLGGNWLSSFAPGGQPLSVNVSGALVVTGGINAVFGNIPVEDGNFVTASGNIFAKGNIVVDCNAIIGGDVAVGGTIVSAGGSIYNPKAFSVDGNGSSSNYNPAYPQNYQGKNYIGLVSLTSPAVNNYLFLNTADNPDIIAGDHVEIKATNATIPTPLKIVYFTAPSTYTVLDTINDTLLHEYVYFGAPSFIWVKLY